MAPFIFFLKFKNPALDPTDPEIPGPVEEVQAVRESFFLFFFRLANLGNLCCFFVGLLLFFRSGDL